ncbi:hypothetical protein PRZ48_008349 [Zasmidium cellare]|uniref:SnoaL-like domain-containing protein n=1 Tax=Zasmidium cellare TaxID=395010 RepID=A0ABR0EG31_ZASCE|nr:hypothetical protein PRZ48_008349 [Zasmidium cellare]
MDTFKDSVAPRQKSAIHEPNEFSDHHWQQEYTSTAAYLEDLTLRISAELRTPEPRSSPIVLKHVSEDFMLANAEVHECPVPFAGCREHFFEILEQHLKSGGAFAQEITNVSVNVQKGSKRAVVFMAVHERGPVNGKILSREGVSVMHWERSTEDHGAIRQQEAPSNGGCAIAWTPPGQSTAAFLEDMMHALIAEFIRNRNFLASDLYRKHVHPDVTMMGFRGHTTDAVERYVEGDELGWVFEVHNMTAKIRRGTREADVYYTVREREDARSGGKMLMKEVCAEALWQRRVEDGVWQLYRLTLLYGDGDESGPADV